ncbi:MAG: chromosomal replication initiator protein DnaA [Anaplasmataceae bacterium]|nr:chromosomal replication initiator protein DnaA [Anaplasmataceae bacterium]
MDLEQLWQLTLAEMEVQLSRANFITWLKSSRLLDKREGAYYVGLPNNFAKNYVEDKYCKQLLGIMRSFDEGVRKLEFSVIQTDIPQPKKPTLRQTPTTPQGQSAIRFEARIDPETNLNPRYSLSSYVVGPSNELAFAAAEAIVQAVGTKYNPFFVYGGVGVGKTHLIQGIGNEIVARYKRQVKPRYVSSEKFTSDVVWAIRNRRMEDIKKKYRDVDVLIIDDIQFIGGKEKTEQEFFHTFNALYEANKQIIISSDRPPQSIPTLEDRLRSRFEGGLIADVGYPEYELRLAIIRGKLQEFNRVMDEEVVALIAKKVKKNVRELEGVLNKLLFYEESKRTPMTPQVAEEIIDSTINSFSHKVSPDQVVKSVAEFFHVSMEDLTGRRRQKEVVEPRQICMYLLRDILNLSYPFIGERMGRDHTTAIHAFEKINQEVNKNSALNQKILMIKDLIHKNA